MDLKEKIRKPVIVLSLIRVFALIRGEFLLFSPAAAAGSLDAHAVAGLQFPTSF